MRLNGNIKWRKSKIDEVIATYRRTGSITRTAGILGIRYNQVKGVLMTNNIQRFRITTDWTGRKLDTLRNLRAAGLDRAQIAFRMDISVSSVIYASTRYRMPPLKTKGRLYTKDEDEKLLAMRNAGETWPTIAKELNRSMEAVKCRGCFLRKQNAQNNRD